MTRTDLIDHLRRVAACCAAREWVEATPGTPEELWAACHRGDWLLWLAASAGVDRRAVVLAACDCADAAAPYHSDSTRGPALAAIETARRWARGEATDMEVRGAADEADAVSDAVSAAAYAAALERSAGLVRARIPWADVEAALRGGAP